MSWRGVRGLESVYEVSDSGEVRNARTLRLLKLSPCKADGYVRVYMQSKGKRFTRLLHRVVAEAFIKNPSHLPQVNHIDFDRSNNDKSNLEWVSGSENVQHSVRHGRLCPVNSSNMRKKLTPNSVEKIYSLRDKGKTYEEIANEIGVAKSTIEKVLRGISWKPMFRDTSEGSRLAYKSGRLKSRALSSKESKSVREEYIRGGVSYRQLASKYGVSRQTISTAIKAA